VIEDLPKHYYKKKVKQQKKKERKKGIDEEKESDADLFCFSSKFWLN